MLRSHLSYRPGNKGFTLIEVLVAVGLTAVVLTAFYRVFFTMSNAIRAVEEGIGARLEAGRLFDKMTQEVHSSFFNTLDQLTVFEGGMENGHSALTFTSFSYPVMAAGSVPAGSAVVRYRVVSRGEGRVVERSVKNPYTGEESSAEMTGEIEGFDISYYNGSEWSKAWDGKLEKRPPNAVRATLKLRGGEDVSMLARTMKAR